MQSKKLRRLEKIPRTVTWEEKGWQEGSEWREQNGETEHGARCTGIVSRSECAWVTQYQLAACPVLWWKKRKRCSCSYGTGVFSTQCEDRVGIMKAAGWTPHLAMKRIVLSKFSIFHTKSVLKPIIRGAAPATPFSPPRSRHSLGADQPPPAWRPEHDGTVDPRAVAQLPCPGYQKKCRPRLQSPEVLPPCWSRGLFTPPLPALGHHFVKLCAQVLSSRPVIGCPTYYTQAGSPAYHKLMCAIYEIITHVFLYCSVIGCLLFFGTDTPTWSKSTLWLAAPFLCIGNFSYLKYVVLNIHIYLPLAI